MANTQKKTYIVHNFCIYNKMATSTEHTASISNVHSIFLTAARCLHRCGNNRLKRQLQSTPIHFFLLFHNYSCRTCPNIVADNFCQHANLSVSAATLRNKSGCVAGCNLLGYGFIQAVFFKPTAPLFSVNIYTRHPETSTLCNPA